jgi:U11-48K-like CHHC zinc finger
MNSHESIIVKCPFDQSHRVPQPRLLWHVAKCPDHKKWKLEGKPIYHCKFNHSHILLKEGEISVHELNCIDNKENSNI